MTLHKIVNYFYTEFDVGLFVRYVLTVGCICVLMPKEPVTPVEIHSNPPRLPVLPRLWCPSVGLDRGPREK